MLFLLPPLFVGGCEAKKVLLVYFYLQQVCKLYCVYSKIYNLKRYRKVKVKMGECKKLDRLCRICTVEADGICIFSEEGKRNKLEAKIKKYLYIAVSIMRIILSFYCVAEHILNVLKVK